MAKIEKFHDATLVNLFFDWNGQILEITFKPVSENNRTEKMFFEGVESISMPSSHPWGKSSSINSLAENVHGDGFIYSIEMQSGDIIQIYAKNMRFR